MAEGGEARRGEEHEEEEEGPRRVQGGVSEGMSPLGEELLGLDWFLYVFRIFFFSLCFGLSFGLWPLDRTGLVVRFYLFQGVGEDEGSTIRLGLASSPSHGRHGQGEGDISQRGAGVQGWQGGKGKGRSSYVLESLYLSSSRAGVGVG